MHQLVHSSDRHFDQRDHVARRLISSAKPKQRHPKLKIVLEVNNQFDALRVE